MTPWTVIHQVPLSGILQVKILEWVAISYFSGGSDSEASAYNAGDPGSIPGLGRSLEKEMEWEGTHSSTLAWKIPWMEEHGRSMGFQRVGHN